MSDRYDYAKDVRTDKQFENNLKIGKHNQKLAIEQFIIDKHIEKGIWYEYLEQEEETEGAVQYWEFVPDYLLIYQSNIIQVEVKVQMGKLQDYTDFKSNQIEYLVKHNGIILYAIKNHYALIEPKAVKKINNKVFSDKLNSWCYRIDTDIINWKRWLHTPEFMNYESKYTKK